MDTEAQRCPMRLSWVICTRTCIYFTRAISLSLSLRVSLLSLFQPHNAAISAANTVDDHILSSCFQHTRTWMSGKLIIINRPFSLSRVWIAEIGDAREREKRKKENESNYIWVKCTLFSISLAYTNVSHEFTCLYELHCMYLCTSFFTSSSPSSSSVHSERSFLPLLRQLHLSPSLSLSPCALCKHFNLLFPQPSFNFHWEIRE